LKIISATGQAQNGKDTFCDYLQKELNNIPNKIIWERTAFANAVKDTFCQAFEVDRQFIEKWKTINECPPNLLMPVRKALQFIGDGFRQIRSDIWIDIALRDKTKNLIVSDSRYFSEAKAVKEKNGIVFLIYRPGFLNDDPNPSESQIKPLIQWCDKNLTEGPINYSNNIMRYGISIPEELKYFNYFIRNDGSVEDLYSKITKSVVPYILKSHFFLEFSGYDII
jgi:hypothetical protein